MESAVPDQQGRISLESFQRSIHRQHFPYEDPSYLPSSPPPRPGSGSRVQRQSTHPSPSSHPPSSGHHHPRNPVKHIGSPQGHGGYDRDGYRDGYPQDICRAPAGALQISLAKLSPCIDFSLPPRSFVCALPVCLSIAVACCSSDSLLHTPVAMGYIHTSSNSWRYLRCVGVALAFWHAVWFKWFSKAPGETL